LINARGFTLLEIILVLVFIGLIAGLTTPFVMSTLERIKHQSEARKIFSALRYARSEAITSKTVTTFNANIGSNKYWISHKGDKTSPVTKILDPGFTLSYITGNEETIESGTFAVKFYPRGNSDGGTILIAVVAPGKSDSAYEITLDPITGSSRIEQKAQ
jgi:prepilin-type N-terminal cleavage/methylation domain-containing protein